MMFPDETFVPQWFRRFRINGSSIALYLVVLLGASSASANASPATGVPKDLPYLGVIFLTNHNYAAVDSEYFKCERELEVSDPSGLQIVMSVIAGSPAAAAGIRPCDVITSYDHHPPPVTLLGFRMTNSFADVAALVPKTPIGAVVEMQIVRGREVLTVYARIGSRKETAEEMQARISKEEAEIEQEQLKKEEADRRAAQAKEEESERIAEAKEEEARQVAETKKLEEAQKAEADASATRAEEEAQPAKDVAEQPLSVRTQQFSFARILGTLLHQALWFFAVGCLLALTVVILRVWVRYVSRAPS